MTDQYNLQRFIDAQAHVIDSVRRELAAGRKESHWMWFVFPQLRGLGSSSMAEKYGIASRAEAEGYLAHPVLGPRLRECTGLVNAVPNRSVEEIFGYPDDLKFRSSMTLFSSVTKDDAIFQTALDKYFNGKPDSATVSRL